MFIKKIKNYALTLYPKKMHDRIEGSRIKKDIHIFNMKEKKF